MGSTVQKKKTGVDRVIYGFDRLNYWLAYIGGICILIAMLFTTYEVVARFGFNSPTKWSQDFSNYLLLLSIWLSTAYVMLVEGHVKVTILIERIPARARAILTAIVYVLGLVFAVVLTWITAGETYRAYVGNWLPEGFYKFPLFPFYIVICLGSLLLSLAVIQRIFQNVRIAIHPDRYKDETGAQELMPSSQDITTDVEEKQDLE